MSYLFKKEKPVKHDSAKFRSVCITFVQVSLSPMSGRTCVVTTFFTKEAVDGAVSYQRKNMRPDTDLTGPA